ncbi:hypothetical protein KsCSTR_46600 [Candidatus Kuenenia stuttgartiensis]|uniref:Uncharacterized protein n=1 Tax=Kuenenia stuttgartiensis TaxID=174633 RepID=A0A6G7GWR8_KUEST|nr:hypothetical protein KsCSTR_46600 [Candidatus Kuenenia stuttgartiensis]
MRQTSILLGFFKKLNYYYLFDYKYFAQKCKEITFKVLTLKFH